MNKEDIITDEEKKYLRELAKKQLEYAQLPIMKKREENWLNHNMMKDAKPPIVMELRSFIQDLMPELKCKSSLARWVESKLRFWLINHEKINDDKVVPDYFALHWDIEFNQFGDLEIGTERAEDDEGRQLGYKKEHPIQNLEEDFDKLSPSTYSVNREKTMENKKIIEEAIGDILPVKIQNNSLEWLVTPSENIVSLMGLEQMMYAMIDSPQKMHELYQFLIDDMKKYLKWQEKEGLLTLNNGNNYVGSGSYGFTNEIPVDKDKEKVTLKDIWLNMNSQETVGISPDMYGEFIFPYYKEMAKEAGLVYYGCCEPVHDIWDDYVSKLPNLKKVSISPWCDEEIMGEKLKGSDVIYSRKPSPNYIGVGEFHEEDFRDHIKHTLKSAQGCSLELLFRDIYTLNGDLEKPGKAVKIVRELIDKHW